jgi:hypothetical protein
MTPIANSPRCFGVLTKAQFHPLVGGQIKLHGRNFTSFMGAITKGLAFRLPAGAPIVSPGFKIYGLKTFINNFWFAHNNLLINLLIKRG